MRLPSDRTDKRQNFPFPIDGERVYETPPTLIWVPHPDARATHEYTVTVWDDGGRVVFSTVTAQNFAYDTKSTLNGEAKIQYLLHFHLMLPIVLPCLFRLP